MPLLAGGLFNTDRAKQVVEKLVLLAGDQIASEKVMLDDTGFQLIVGRQQMESTGEKVQVLSDGLSVLAGRLFSKDKAAKNIDDLDIERVKKTEGRYLGDSCWGSYTVVSYGKQLREITFYRDPQGFSSLFYLIIDGGVLFASDISYLYDALPEKPELDWSYLTSYVITPHAITNHTPFKGVLEAQSGCATTISLDGQTKVKMFWDPTTYAGTYVEDEEAFQEELYQTFQACTAAWAREADKVCLELSGGLDSSAVLCALKDGMKKDTEILGVNIMHSQVSSSNEVAYAKNVADICNVPLKVVDWSKRLPFATTKLPHRYNRPSTFFFDYEFNRQLISDIPFGPQSEFMCGQGGDHLFLAPPSVETIADYFLDKGLRGIGAKISEISAYHRMPYMRVVGSTLSSLANYMTGRLNYLSLEPTKASWMKQALLDKTNDSLFKPYYWERLKSVSPAKAQHILAVDQATLYLDRGYRYAGKPVLNPLLSQPLVELGLSMPVYQSFSGGYNRVHFRRAMAKHAQGDFIWRKSKGETSGVMVLAVQERFKDLCKLVLEGRFAQEGLVDTDLLLERLNELRHGKMGNPWPIFNLMVSEIWFRSWQV